MNSRHESLDWDPTGTFSPSEDLELDFALRSSRHESSSISPQAALQSLGTPVPSRKGTHSANSTAVRPGYLRGSIGFREQTSVNQGGGINQKPVPGVPDGHSTVESEVTWSDVGVKSPDLERYPSAVLSGHVVTLHRDHNGRFGLSFEVHRIGVRVVDIRQGSPCAKSAALHAGDYIVEINGTSIQSTTSDRIQSLLQASKGPASVVVVPVSAVDSMLRTVQIEATVSDSQGLGIEVFGDDGEHPRIRSVIPNGPADLTGRVFVGDRVLQIDERRTELMSVQELRTALDTTNTARLLLQLDQSPLYPFLVDRSATQVTVKLPRSLRHYFECCERKTESGVFVTKILPNADPNIREGYKIVEVNGENVEMATMSTILILLTEDGFELNTVVFEASRVRSVTLDKESLRDGFGLTLQAFDDDAEQAFRIVDVVGDSPAARSGDLQGGDNIISINGVPTTELTYAKAIHTLTTTTRVTLEAERGRQGPSLQLSTSKTNQQHHAVFLRDAMYSTLEYITVTSTSAKSNSGKARLEQGDRVVIDDIFVRDCRAMVNPVQRLGMLGKGDAVIAIDSVYLHTSGSLDIARDMLSSTGLPSRAVITVAQ
eukprot:m.47552 g.47552  ORF g.47552 m.47552 type:complete len:601 (+) comp8870_c0_seq2:163-1965(+)